MAALTKGARRLHATGESLEILENKMKHLYTSWAAGLLSRTLSGALTACNVTGDSISVKTPTVDSDKWVQITPFNKDILLRCLRRRKVGCYLLFRWRGVAYSTNGVNWTEITVSATNWFDAAYGSGKWLAVGNSGVAYNGRI